MALVVASLNLHGYHPMGEPRRWFEARDGQCQPAPAEPYFFTTDELDRGHRRRLDALAEDLFLHRPDLIFLQQVGAGTPWADRSTDAFYHSGGPEQADWFERNSALRLADRLQFLGKSVRREVGLFWPALACRGNIGWNTSPSTFAGRRVVRFTGAERRAVFDFNANPYPGGILIEGLASLVRSSWVLLDHQALHVPASPSGGAVYVQLLTIDSPTESPEGGPYVLAQAEVGEGFALLEHLVAMRSALGHYVRLRESEGGRRHKVRGIVVAIESPDREAVHRWGQVLWTDAEPASEALHFTDRLVTQFRHAVRTSTGVVDLENRAKMVAEQHRSQREHFPHLVLKSVVLGGQGSGLWISPQLAAKRASILYPGLIDGATHAPVPRSGVIAELGPKS